MSNVLISTKFPDSGTICRSDPSIIYIYIYICVCVYIIIIIFKKNLKNTTKRLFDLEVRQVARVAVTLSTIR